MLKTSLYGDRLANLAWDETQCEWFTSPDVGFEKLPSDGSIFVKRSEKGLIIVLNVVDNQLYFPTTKELKFWFEDATQQRFDVKILGQATWYLQSRTTD
jgi:hypothetical protein